MNNEIMLQALDDALLGQIKHLYEAVVTDLGDHDGRAQSKFNHGLKLALEAHERACAVVKSLPNQ